MSLLSKPLTKSACCNILFNIDFSVSVTIFLLYSTSGRYTYLFFSIWMWWQKQSAFAKKDCIKVSYYLSPKCNILQRSRQQYVNNIGKLEIYGRVRSQRIDRIGVGKSVHVYLPHINVFLYRHAYIFAYQFMKLFIK